MQWKIIVSFFCAAFYAVNLQKYLRKNLIVKNFSFNPLEIPENAPELRNEVREFLKREMVGISPLQRAHSWLAFDADFSRKLAAQGWIGMIWPRKYGGHERSAIERYIVLEELLTAGAPVGAHWIADRQSGNLLLRFGNEEQRQRFLPPITQGEMYFCIGMSEANAGSDLAAVRTKASRIEEGWKINGSKLWTTHADKAHFMIALVRTSSSEENRHAGLSQFLIDLSSPGLTINPITDLVGENHFSEVFFEDVIVPDNMLIGNEGDGWKQVTAELSLERSGPERYLSSYRLLEEFILAVGEAPTESVLSTIGELTAELWTLRQMSMSVAGQLSEGKEPALEATIVKDLGACFEQNLPRVVQATINTDEQYSSNSSLKQVLEYLLQTSPSFSLRGGTREILRGIIARGLGLR